MYSEKQSRRLFLLECLAMFIWFKDDENRAVVCWEWPALSHGQHGLGKKLMGLASSSHTSSHLYLIPRSAGWLLWVSLGSCAGLTASACDASLRWYSLAWQQLVLPAWLAICQEQRELTCRGPLSSPCCWVWSHLQTESVGLDGMKQMLTLFLWLGIIVKGFLNRRREWLKNYTIPQISNIIDSYKDDSSYHLFNSSYAPSF